MGIAMRMSLAIASVAFAACPVDRDTPGAMVMNESGGKVQIVLLQDEGELVVTPALRDGSFERLGGVELGGDTCSRDVLVARRPNGEIVERRPPPLCEDDEWVIDGEPDSEEASSR